MSSSDRFEWLLKLIDDLVRPFGFAVGGKEKGDVFERLPFNLNKQAAEAVMPIGEIPSSPERPIPLWIVGYLDYLQDVVQNDDLD